MQELSSYVQLFELFVPNLCDDRLHLFVPTPLCSYTPMFLHIHPYVPTPLCSYTPMLRQPMFLHPYVPTTYVPTPLCSYTPMFLHPMFLHHCVPTPLCSYAPMFLRPYIPFPPIFRHFLLDQHWVSGTN